MVCRRSIERPLASWGILAFLLNDHNIPIPFPSITCWTWREVSIPCPFWTAPINYQLNFGLMSPLDKAKFQVLLTCKEKAIETSLESVLSSELWKSPCNGWREGMVFSSIVQFWQIQKIPWKHEKPRSEDHLSYNKFCAKDSFSPWNECLLEAIVEHLSAHVRVKEGVVKCNHLFSLFYHLP
jgi:hypothetical protein